MSSNQWWIIFGWEVEFSHKPVSFILKICILKNIFQVLSITVFKSSGFRELYMYRKTSRDYWPVWARQLGAAIQLTPILVIPGVAIIQTCRYLNNGPPDIFDVRVRVSSLKFEFIEKNTQKLTKTMNKYFGKTIFLSLCCATPRPTRWK